MSALRPLSEFVFLMTLACLATGCAQSGTPIDPAAIDPSESPIPEAAVALARGTVQQFGGGVTLRIDPTVPAATVVGWRTVSQNDDTYFLPIDNFLSPRSVRVTRIAVNGPTLDLDYRITHPFAAPANLDAPATAANRADLGIAARVLILADLPTGDPVGDHTFFGGEAIANTLLVANTDGYSAPADLLSMGGVTANTFPYKLVVDESEGSGGNRVGLSNGGSGSGNYTPGTGGWQRGNMGPDRAGWTGYEVLHQGQAATTTVQLNLAALGGTVELDLALIAKYNDPRNGANATEKRANRLPANPADIFKFGYRMPHGALDASKVVFLDDTGGLAGNDSGSSTVLRFHVTDFDARATPSGTAALDTDPDPSRVIPGAQGLPVVTIDLPGITTSPAVLTVVDDDTAYGGDVGQDSGIARDPLFYEGSVFNQESAPEGSFRGLARVVDPEDALNRSGYELALDANLTPVANGPRPVTYQAIAVTVGAAGGCTPREIAFTFDSDAAGWSSQGTNSDWFDWGHFRQGCANAISEAGSGGMLSSGGTYLSTGDDGDNASCEFTTDYGPKAENDIVSAVLQLPAMCTPGTLAVTFNAYLCASGQATATLQISTDYGATWQAPLWSETGTGVAETFGNISFTLPDGLAGGPLRLRFHFSESASTQFESPGGELAGLAIDNVRIALESTDPITLQTGAPVATCGPRTHVFDFDDGQGWQGGQFFGLSNGDNQAIHAPLVGGFGSFRWTICDGMTDSTNTYSPVVAASGGAIVGFSLNIGADSETVDGGTGTFCGFLDDYGGTPQYNIVSPAIWLPPNCAGNSYTLQWDAYLNTNAVGGLDPATVRCYVSDDNGATWGTAVWTASSLAGGTFFGNVTADLSALSGNTEAVRIRYEFTSSAGSVRQKATPAQAFGFYVDNVELIGTNVGGEFLIH